MDDIVYATHCTDEAIPIPDISYEKADGFVVVGRVFLGHLELFLFVPGEDYESFDVGVFLIDICGEGLSQGACAAGDEDGFIG